VTAFVRKNRFRWGEFSIEVPIVYAKGGIWKKHIFGRGQNKKEKSVTYGSPHNCKETEFISLSVRSPHRVVGRHKTRGRELLREGVRARDDERFGLEIDQKDTGEERPRMLQSKLRHGRGRLKGEKTIFRVFLGREKGIQAVDEQDSHTSRRV